MEQDVIGFNQFLVWLMAGGSALAVSWLLERIPSFQALESATRKMVSYGSAALVAVGAYALVTFAPEFVAQAEPIFKILAMVFGSIFLNNAFHKLDKVN